ncbi:MAG: hypothetical protein FJ029_04565 [Actinobacteria bacterium]|nr:hypothetical protein [Actinomycetota bacterium]
MDADFAGYLRSRVQTVVSLVRALRQAAQPVPVSAYLGSGPAGTDGGWASGLVAEALVAAEALDTALVGMYGFSPPEARRAYATARATVQDRAEVGAMLSGIAPDVTTSEEIVGTVRALAEMGLGRVNIYNYGLMRRPVLAALGRALA